MLEIEHIAHIVSKAVIFETDVHNIDMNGRNYITDWNEVLGAHERRGVTHPEKSKSGSLYRQSLNMDGDQITLSKRTEIRIQKGCELKTTFSIKK